MALLRLPPPAAAAVALPRGTAIRPDYAVLGDIAAVHPQEGEEEAARGPPEALPPVHLLLRHVLGEAEG